MLTIDSIILKLRKDGWNSKEKVINALQYADVKELKQLRRSIDERIALLESGVFNEKKETKKFKNDNSDIKLSIDTSRNNANSL